MNSKEMWEQRHKKTGFRFNKVTQFAKDIYYRYLKDRKGKLLELGCGKGADSMFFHYKGFQVSALDFSKNAISTFNQIQQEKGLFISALVKDFTEKLSYEDEYFDVVYSRISLNYFTDEITKNIFSEIERVLKSEGLFIFQVKSTKDKDYGQGTQVDDDVFEDEEIEGYQRHFFSEEYVKELLHPQYKIIVIQELNIPNGNAYLNVVAKKK